MMNVFTLSAEEKQQIFDLAQKLVGGYSEPQLQHDITVSNLLTRIRMTGCKNLAEYLQYTLQNEQELASMISALTIHTTSWFRELPHFRNLEASLLKRGSELKRIRYRMLCVGCSSGEEVYSFAFVLESFRRRFNGFEYEVVGVDIDPISLRKARSGIYNLERLAGPPEYRPFLIPSHSGETKQYAVDPKVKHRVKFITANAMQLQELHLGGFDHVVCRNMLLYFGRERSQKIIKELLNAMGTTGTLTLGHCDPIQPERFRLRSIGNSSFKRFELAGKSPRDFHQEISVLIVDDSKTVSHWLSNAFEKRGIRSFSASSAEEATEVLARHPVDLITLDLNLPGQHGLSWLRERRASGMGTPVVLFTEVHAEKAPEVLEALDGLAQDYLNKASVARESSKFLDSVISLVQAQRDRRQGPVSDKVQVPGKVARPYNPELICIGASTGGTDAIRQLLSSLPSSMEECPPVVVVQHIPTEFAAAFSARLAEVSGLKVGQATTGTVLEKQTLYIAVDPMHLGIRLSGGKLVIHRQQPEGTESHCPSVDYLFDSAAMLPQTRVMAFLLTGMGKDGARGLMELRRNGAFTAVQSKETSAVWGMPGEAVRLGAAEFEGSPQELRGVLANAIRSLKTRKAA